MFFQNHKLFFSLSAVTLAIQSVAYANVPNAGTISRDIKQETQAVAVQKIAEPQKQTREQQASDSIEIAVQKIRVLGAEAVAEQELAVLAQEYEGKTVTLGQLHELTDKISDYYNQQGYHLARAILPPQRIDKGEVVIQVFEGKIAGVQLMNNSRLKDSVAQTYLERGIETGKALNRQKSERTLLLLRDLAGVGAINYSLVEGNQVGETNLVASLEGAPLLSGNLSLDNYGNKSTGRARTRLNLYLNNPFGRGERFTLQGMSSFDGLDYGFVGLDLPVGYHGLSFNTSFSHTQYELGDAFEKLDADGYSDTFSAGLRYPLLRSNQHNLWVSANGEYRNLTDRVRATKTETKKIIKSGNISLNGSFQDNLLAGGYTSFYLQNTFGHLRFRSDDARAIDAVSAKTAGGYYKLNLSLSRTQFFTPELSLWANLNAQWSHKNLDSGEQLSLGGIDGVSAYTSNAVSGDKGVIANLQLRYAINQFLALNTFYDVGHATLRNKPFTDEKNHRTLQGAGIGLNFQFKDLMLEAKSAWKINNPSDSKESGPQVWLKGSYYF